MPRISNQTLDTILPPPRVSSFEWICEHACTKRGMPFDYLSYPWTEGICAEWDNPRRERVFFQAGSRLGKTELGLSLLECGMATAPDIAMMGGPTGDKVEQWIKDRLTPMVEQCGPLKDWLPPSHRRSKHTLHLRHGTIYGAWSGSPTTLGDLDPRYLMAFEIDKFTKASSEEADSLLLLLERGAEIPNRHVFCESTPTVSGKSRIDKFVRQGTNCRFHVPCEKCGKFQQLVIGNGEFGLVWDKNAEGKSEPNLAFNTARYRCKFCQRDLHETDRFTMIQKGVWCPEGQTVDKKGKLRGTMVSDGPDASFQLSRMYGPSFTFGRYARAFVEAAHDPDPEVLRSFKNNWEGICWLTDYSMKPWEEVAGRLCQKDLAFRQVPADGQFITMGVDVQVDHWVFYVASWSTGGKGATLNFGIVYSWKEVKELIETFYPHADGGPSLSPVFTVIDARDGNRTDEVKAFCKSMNMHGRWVLPCMGSGPNALKGRSYTKTKLDAAGKDTSKSHRRGLDEFYLITVGTNFYQNWVHNALNRRNPGEDNSVIFPDSARYNEDFFEQLLSEHPEWQTDDRCIWVKTTPKTVNDLRDTLRYCRCAADVYTNENWQQVRSSRLLTVTGKVPGAGIPKSNKQSSGPPPDPNDRKKPRWVRRMKVRS